MRDVHEGCGLQRVGQVPACSRSGREALDCGNPYHTPHTGTANCRARCSRVGLHRGKMVAPRQKLDGGWRQWAAAGRRGLDATTTPPMRADCGHDLLPAANFGGAKAPQPLRELVSSSQAAGGWKGVQGPCSVARCCRASALIASGPARPSCAFRANDQAQAVTEPTEAIKCAVAKAHRSCVEEGWGSSSGACSLPVGAISEKPPAVKPSAKPCPGRVRKVVETGCHCTEPRKS